MRGNTLRLIAPLAVLALLGLAACGGGGSDQDASESPATTDGATTVTLVNPGKLTVCTNPPYDPFELVENGKVTGFDLDLMGEVAKDLGVEVEARETPFESIESAASLDVDDCDVGATAMTITEDRKAKLDFSQPYWDSNLGLLVPADSGITTLADLEGKEVGVQQGTTGEDWANAQAELSGHVRQYENLGDEITALQTGDVAGVFNDVPVLNPYVTDGYTVVTFDTGEQFGFCVKKGNQALLDAINATLDRIHSDGTFDQLAEKWSLVAAG
jgi:polar amino acid transport system substrate-binding protein